MKIVNKSKRQPNKLWIDQGKQFYNSPMLKWLDNSDILMYSKHNEGKLVVAERFTKTLKCKMYKQWQLMIVNLVLLIWVK